MPVKNKLDRVAIDILGEPPETDNGNKYILVVTDYYTKWTHAMALPNQLAQTVADKLLNEFITIFGTPKFLHSDQGRNFESNLFQQMCKLLGIEKTRTTPFHAQSDGQVERFNRTLQQMLKAFVNKNRDDWDDHLPYLCMAYRATVHESTGCTPNLMMFGQENNMPVDIQVGHPPKSKPDIQCPVEYVEWLRESLSKVYQYADEQLQQNAKRQKHYYDIRSKPHTYKVGEFVWRWYPPINRGKLSKGWSGPFKIIELVGKVNCIVKYSPDSEGIRVHIDSLKPYCGPTPLVWEVISGMDVENTTNDDIQQSPSQEESEINGETSPSSLRDTPENDYTYNGNLQTDNDATESKAQILGRGYRKRKPLVRFSP